MKSCWDRDRNPVKPSQLVQGRFWLCCLWVWEAVSGWVVSPACIVSKNPCQPLLRWCWTQVRKWGLPEPPASVARLGSPRSVYIYVFSAGQQTLTHRLLCPSSRSETRRQSALCFSPVRPLLLLLPAVMLLQSSPSAWNQTLWSCLHHQRGKEVPSPSQMGQKQSSMSKDEATALAV